MDPDRTKFVVVVDGQLPSGLAANTAAVVAASVGAAAPELIGPEVRDASGNDHPGITRLPIAVLKCPQAGIREVLEGARAAGLTVVPFSSVAQRSRDYAAYAAELRRTPAGDLELLGLGIIGERRAVAGLTGALSLLR